jgi:cystathionine beta-lyase/cystathionine gamma-synthase
LTQAVSRSQTDDPISAIDSGVPDCVVRLHIGFEGADLLWLI